MCLYSSTFKQKWKSFRQHIAHCTALDNVSAFTFRPLGSFCSQPLFFTFQCHSSKSQSPVRLTLDGKQGLVHLPRQEGFGQVPEELLEDGGHIVHADLLRQDHVRTAVEILAQLKYRQGSVCSVQWGINAAPGALASDWFPPWRCPRCWGRAAPGIYKHSIVTRNPQASIYWT